MMMESYLEMEEESSIDELVERDSELINKQFFFLMRDDIINYQKILDENKFSYSEEQSKIQSGYSSIKTNKEIAKWTSHKLNELLLSKYEPNNNLERIISQKEVAITVCAIANYVAKEQSSEILSDELFFKTNRMKRLFANKYFNKLLHSNINTYEVKELKKDDRQYFKSLGLGLNEAVYTNQIINR